MIDIKLSYDRKLPTYNKRRFSNTQVGDRVTTERSPIQYPGTQQYYHSRRTEAISTYPENDPFRGDQCPALVSELGIR